MPYKDPILRLSLFHIAVIFWAVFAWVRSKWALYGHIAVSLAIPGFVALVISPLGSPGMSFPETLITLALWEAVPIVYVAFLFFNRQELLSGQSRHSS